MILRIILPLEADGATWDTDASNPGRPDPVPGSNLFLGAAGGHPGSGNPDRYALAREFANGVVLSNPSVNNHTFDLAALFPGRSFQRLQGSALQDPIVNDGTAVGSTVVVGPRDGLFLLKTGDTLQPRWQSVVGRRYRIYYSTNPVNWISVGSDFEGTGYEITAPIPKALIAEEERLYLRIKVLGAP